LGRPERQAQLVTRHRAGVAAHLLPLERLPSALVPSTGTNTVITPLQEHPEASHPVFERLLRYGIDCLLVTALPGDAGLFWAGKRGVPCFSAAQMAAFEPLVLGLPA